ncbi:MAG: hypothetical protein ACK415_11755 [Thermodesulfovibrionales bacterium]
MSTTGTPRINNGATGGTLLPFPCVTAIERKARENPIGRLPHHP